MKKWKKIIQIVAVTALALVLVVPVFADDIYDRLVMDDKVHISAAALAPDLPVITFNGLSKSHIICGFRCGWAGATTIP